MYIAVFKNNGKDYLRLMESYIRDQYAAAGSN